tara:strand:+ start:1306 stop:1725 length:420 start_codon:yes stop_codon:yes gene_type:complete
MRVDNWASKLELIISKTINNEFIRGKNDCFTFVLDSIQAITGKKVFNKKYQTLTEAKKLIKILKCKDLLDVLLKITKENNFKVIDIDKAQKGDILYYTDNRSELNGTVGVCVGEKIMFNWKNEIALISKNNCKIAWRIE